MQQAENFRTWENNSAWPPPWEDFTVRTLPQRDFRTYLLNDVPVVTAPAELDVYNQAQLGNAILAAAANVMVVVLDMTATTFCDCSGLGSVIRARRRLEDHGVELRVASSHERVRWLMAYFGDDRRLQVFDTLPEAVTAMWPAVRPENWSPRRQAA